MGAGRELDRLREQDPIVGGEAGSALAVDKPQPVGGEHIGIEP